MKQLKIGTSITRRENPALEMYLQSIGREERIGIDDEVELAQRIRKGDHEALEKLTLANLRFVVSVAKQYQNQGLPLSDLISEGNIGPIKAAERFDETRGFKFISYAVWWIRQSIMQALAEQGRCVRLPLNQVGMQNKISKAVNQFLQDNNRPPSDDELAEILELSADKIGESRLSNGKVVSIDAPIGEDDGNTMNETLFDKDARATDDALMDESLSCEINRLLDTLTPREKSILKMSFGLGQHEESLEEIGLTFGLTRERVRQIREKSIRTLRKRAKNGRLKQFLGR